MQASVLRNLTEFICVINVEPYTWRPQDYLPLEQNHELLGTPAGHDAVGESTEKLDAL